MNNKTSISPLLQKLDAFIKKYYKNQLIKGLIYSLSIFLAIYLLLTVSEHFLYFNSAVRTTLFYGFLALNVFVFSKYIVLPLLKLYKLKNGLNYTEAAKIIGVHFPEVNDKLLNTLQLQQQANNKESELLLASINQKITDLKPIPFGAAIDFTVNSKYLKYLLPPIFVFGVLFFTNSKIITASTKRIINYQQDFEKEAPFTFTIENNNLQALKNENFNLKLKVSGFQIPDEVSINFDGQEYLLQKQDKIHFSYAFKNLQKTTGFNFKAGGFTSKKYEITVLPKPQISFFNTFLVYPKHTGLKNELIENNGDITVPEGTVVNWDFTTTDTDSLKFILHDSLVFKTAKHGNNFKFKKQFFKDATYSIVPSNNQVKKSDKIDYAITVIKDEYPSITVQEKRDSLAVKQVYFKGLIKDDYGFNSLTFNYSIKNAKTNVVKKSFRVSIPSSKTLNQQDYFYYWNIKDIETEAGDVIEYYFTVRDNDAINGLKATKSNTKIFKIPSLEELAKKQEKNSQEMQESMKQTINKAHEIKEGLNEFKKKLVNKKELTWQDKKELQKLLEEQKKLQNKVEKMQDKNQQNVSEQNEFDKTSEEILKKQAELAKLFDEVLDEKTKEMMLELEKLLEKELDKQKAQDILDKMSLTNEELEKELDRNLELYKRLEVETKMDKAINRLNELQKEQEKLAEKSKQKNADSEAIKKEQDQLNKKFDDLQKEMENIKKKNAELEKPMDLDTDKKAQEDIKKEMEESSDKLEQKNNKKASESQKDASDKMKSLSKNLQAMMESNKMKQISEDADALRQVLENLLVLSFDQEELMNQLSQISSNDPKYVVINKNQKKLRDNAKMVEDTLIALGKRVTQIESIIHKEIDAIQLNLDKTIGHLAERETHAATVRQQYVMTATNNLALLLSEILQQMQNQMQQNMSGSGSCNNPNPGGKPSMGDMKSLQEQLSKQLEQMKNGSKPGEKPGQNKGGQMPGMPGNEGLVKMAAQQEQIRKQIQGMKQQLQKKPGGKGTGGDLDELSKLMEENERDIINKNITRETINRQEEIMTRLLEAEKAEREREKDDKRISKTADEQIGINNKLFLEYKKQKTQELELLKTIPPSLKPYYKKKATEYFNN